MYNCGIKKQHKFASKLKSACYVERSAMYEAFCYCAFENVCKTLYIYQTHGRNWQLSIEYETAIQKLASPK